MNEYKFKSEVDECQKSIKNYEGIKVFMDNVKYLTKKDGKPFAKIESNFSFEGFDRYYITKDKFSEITNYKFEFKYNDIWCCFRIWGDGILERSFETFNAEFKKFRDQIDSLIDNQKKRLEELNVIRDYIINFEKETLKKFPHAPKYALKDFIDFYI